MAVGHHPFRVLGAFTGGGPVDTLFVGCFDFIVSADDSFGNIDFESMVVGATRFGGRATDVVGFASITARLHAVGSHPLGVFVALVVFGGGPGFTSVFGVVRVGDAQIFAVSRRALASFQSVFTGADRAARFATVLEHPVGVGGTFRRRLSGPSGTEGVFVFTFGFVSRAEGFVFGLDLGLFFLVQAVLELSASRSGLFFDVSSTGGGCEFSIFDIAVSVSVTGFGGVSVPDSACSAPETLAFRLCHGTDSEESQKKKLVHLFSIK